MNQVGLKIELHPPENIRMYVPANTYSIQQWGWEAALNIQWSWRRLSNCPNYMKICFLYNYDRTCSEITVLIPTNFAIFLKVWVMAVSQEKIPYCTFQKTCWNDGNEMAASDFFQIHSWFISVFEDSLNLGITAITTQTYTMNNNEFGTVLNI